jgi:ABC-type transport system involved in multi-copper enzyme maturation permease subunit
MSAAFRAGVVKEVRALLPLWSACMLAVAAAWISRSSWVSSLAVLAFVVGSAALGAYSIGHEYSHRTLNVLLSQPVDRRVLYATKLVVLAASLGSLALLAPDGLADAWVFRQRSIWRQPVAVLPAFCGLCLAPWFTMVCRNATAGVLFTLALPLSLLTAGDAFWIADAGPGDDDLFWFGMVWCAMLAVCGAAAIAGWRTFLRLESFDGEGAQIELPQWLGRGTSTRRRTAFWWLVKKELHLQQMTLVVVLMYVCGWAVLSIVGRMNPGLDNVVMPLTIIYLALLAILIGSLASAEERQYGTLEWQMLMPIPAWHQWVVKAGVAIGLAVVLGVGLATLLNLIQARSFDPQVLRIGRHMLGPVVLLTVSSLYVSSLCSSGVKAVVLTLPIWLGLSLLTRAANDVASRLQVEDRLLEPIAGAFRSRGVTLAYTDYWSALWGLALILGALYTALLLRLAFVNHRSVERSGPRIVRQALWIAAFVVLAITLTDALRVFFRT